MPVHDLTPQLRTRLSRVERAVGWFVIVATVLLLAGFAYYVYHVAQRKGWFLTKIPYFTYVRNAEGLHVGDPIRLMGFDVGEIVEIQPESADNEWARINEHNVAIKFQIKSPYFGYVLSDSIVRVATADLLGKRVLEVTRGLTGIVTVVVGKSGPPMILEHKDPKKANYITLTKDSYGYWVQADESPALSQRLEQLVNQVQGALPNFLRLTNQITLVLSNTATLTEHLDETALRLRPPLANLSLITAQLTNGPGALGHWLIPPDLNSRLQQTLASANTTLLSVGNTLTNADTNIVVLASNLNKTLINLAEITGNLNTQVQTNDQILSQISSAIVHADTLMQGLKKHWLLRSAFKDAATNAPAPSPRQQPLKAGKQQ